MVNVKEMPLSICQLVDADRMIELEWISFHSFSSIIETITADNSLYTALKMDERQALAIFR